jgi:hypothetical protein
LKATETEQELPDATLEPQVFWERLKDVPVASWTEFRVKVAVPELVIVIGSGELPVPTA